MKQLAQAIRNLAGNRFTLGQQAASLAISMGEKSWREVAEYHH